MKLTSSSRSDRFQAARYFRTTVSADSLILKTSLDQLIFDGAYPGWTVRKPTRQAGSHYCDLGSFALAAFRSVVRNETAYRNARLPYRSSETSSPTGRRVVGPYLPSGQPRGITTQGVTFHGRPKARLASRLLHSGAVISAAPNPAARAASKRFCTAGLDRTVGTARKTRRPRWNDTLDACHTDDGDLVEVVCLPLHGLQ